MNRSLPVKTILFIACMVTQVFYGWSQPFNESFNDITTLVPGGWFMQNNSVPLGITGWSQGVPPPTGPFNSNSGATNAYITANFNNTTGGTGTISNWLLTPNRTFRNGDVLTFYTRVPGVGTIYPDRLEVRLSTNGASTNVGTGAAAFGDFTTLLLSVNPSLSNANYPTGYPFAWTQFTITISGLPAPTSGRIGFRYFVTAAGPTGTNSDYIGIDDVVYTPYVCPTLTVTPTTLTGGTAGSAYSASLSQTGALGAPGYAVTAGALPPGLTLSAGGTISGTPTATGTFNFTVTVSDASGCSGSRPYSVTVVCPANPINFPAFTPVCSNDAPLTLSSASPAGGTYSGNGVSGGQFDPAAGSQTITYDMTDPYGCAHSSNQTITVNTAPTVSQAAVNAVCSNASPVALSGGSPAGGTYTGTGVSGGQFDPAAGTQTLTYTYTDGNGCTDDATFTVTVNTAPTAIVNTVPPVCSNAAAVTLSAAPSGGTFAGTGVTGDQFDPASGTQGLTYTLTDGNNCTVVENFTVTVNTAPTVTHGAVAATCSNASPITLSGGSPAGGTYTGTGVTGTQFDPASGTQTITYTYTDANNCTNAATFSVTVNNAPTATFTLPATVCVYGAPFAFNGTPAGGAYTGDGASGTQFNPATAGTGPATVTYTYTDGNGCSDDAQATITVSACLGNEENELANAVTVFPNPTNGMVTLTINNFGNDTQIDILDLQGKRIYGTQVSATGTYTQTIDITGFANGIYYLRIGGQAGSVVKTLVKQ